MRLLSWNVNGIRAVHKRGDLDWLWTSDLDVIGVQETKVHDDQVPAELRAPPGWRSFWEFGVRKGYSGTAIFVREEWPVERIPFLVGGDTHPEMDREGRLVALDLGAFFLLNIYFPNGGSNDERLAFKHAWHDAFLDKVKVLQQQKPVVITGDFNVAHRPIDVAMPEAWASGSGFLPVERAWFDRLLAAGFIDTFRAEKGDLARQYTFWETRLDLRKDNIGWRIDYFVASKALEDTLLDAWISPQVFGSDHCPVGIELQLPRPARPRSPVMAVESDDATELDDGSGDAIDEDEAPRRRR